MQKSGTHALMAWFAMMGLKRAPGLLDGRHTRLTPKPGMDGENPTMKDILKGPMDTFIHGHVHPRYVGRLSAARVVTIFRDPRDQIVSFARYAGMPNENGVINAMRAFNRIPFVRAYRGFLGWRGECLCLRYEDIPRDFARADLYPDVEFNGTLNETPSRWRDWWTDRIDKEWTRLGGPELLKDAGYA